MTEDEWVKFCVSGEPKLASVGRLDHDLCKRLRTSNDLVRMRHDYALKLMHKHKFSPDYFGMLEFTMLYGRVVSDRKWHLTFFHYDDIVFGSWLQLTIKSADSGNELWVSTFHRQSHTEVTRHCKKHTVLRQEKM